MTTGLRACLAVGSLLVLMLIDFSGAALAREGDRTLKFYYTHTRERAEFTFKRNGRYDRAELERMNRFLRDWRRGQPTRMDPQLFDLLWAVYRQTGSRDYIHIVSAFRSTETNNMLRKRSRAVAQRSQHTLGKAMDFFIPGVPASKIRAIAMRLQGGGVGFYPGSRSQFVHLDTGNVRHWPRMTRRQLVALFPDGETVHLPSDGKPLPGFKRALAKYGRGKGTQLAALETRGGALRGDASANGTLGGWLKKVFTGGADEEEDIELGRQAPSTPAPEAPRPAAPEEPTMLVAANEAGLVPPPLPKTVPQQAREIVLASLAGAPAPAVLAVEAPITMVNPAPDASREAAVATLALAPMPKLRPGMSADDESVAVPGTAIEAVYLAALASPDPAYPAPPAPKPVASMVAAMGPEVDAKLPNPADVAVLASLAEAAAAPAPEPATAVPAAPASAVAAANALVHDAGPAALPQARPAVQLAYSADAVAFPAAAEAPMPKLRPAAMLAAVQPAAAAPRRDADVPAAAEAVAIQPLMQAAAAGTRQFARLEMPRPTRRSGLFVAPTTASDTAGRGFTAPAPLPTDRFSLSDAGAADAATEVASLR